MTGESHLENALGAGGGSDSGESHIANCLTGIRNGQTAGESHIQACQVNPLLLPPLLPDLLHWFDFADPTVLFQDAAGIVPIVAGQDIIRVNNKGTDGTPIIDAFPPGPIWTLGLVNGLAGAVNTGNFTAMQQSSWGGAGGTSMVFGLVRANDIVTSSTGVFFQQSSGGEILLLRDTVGNPGDWAVSIGGIPSFTSTTRSLVLNEWNYVYGGEDNVGTITYRASGAAKQTMAGVFSGPGASATVGLSGGRTDLIEILCYGRGLTAAEQSLVTAYLDARAGATLPF